MRVIIQKYDEGSEKLCSVAKNMGLEVNYVGVDTIYNTENLIKEYEPVFTHTSIDSFNHLSSKYKFSHLYNKNSIKPTSYMGVLGETYFNSEGMFLPAPALIKRFKCLQELWDNKYLFVKSNEDKVLTGEVFEDETSIKHALDYFTLKHNSLMLVAPSYQISREWRVVRAGKKVVTASLYKKDGKVVSEEEEGISVISFAETIPVWDELPHVHVLDICQDPRGFLYVLEVGSVNVAGFYSCNLKKILEASIGQLEIANGVPWDQRLKSLKK